MSGIIVPTPTASVSDAFDSASKPAISSFNYAWDRDLQIGSPYFGDVTALQTALTRAKLNALCTREVMADFN